MMDLAKLVKCLVLICFCDNLNMENRVNDFRNDCECHKFPFTSPGPMVQAHVKEFRTAFLHFEFRGNVNDYI